MQLIRRCSFSLIFPLAWGAQEIIVNTVGAAYIRVNLVVQKIQLLPTIIHPFNLTFKFIHVDTFLTFIPTVCSVELVSRIFDVTKGTATSISLFLRHLSCITMYPFQLEAENKLNVAFFSRSVECFAGITNGNSLHQWTPG